MVQPAVIAQTDTDAIVHDVVAAERQELHGRLKWPNSTPLPKDGKADWRVFVRNRHERLLSGFTNREGNLYHFDDRKN
jgi:hypothetical protein